MSPMDVDTAFQIESHLHRSPFIGLVLIALAIPFALATTMNRPRLALRLLLGLLAASILAPGIITLVRPPLLTSSTQPSANQHKTDPKWTYAQNALFDELSKRGFEPATPTGQFPFGHDEDSIQTYAGWIHDRDGVINYPITVLKDGPGVHECMVEVGPSTWRGTPVTTDCPSMKKPPLIIIDEESLAPSGWSRDSAPDDSGTFWATRGEDPETRAQCRTFITRKGIALACRTASDQPFVVQLKN